MYPKEGWKPGEKYVVQYGFLFRIPNNRRSVLRMITKKRKKNTKEWKKHTRTAVHIMHTPGHCSPQFLSVFFLSHTLLMSSFGHLRTGLSYSWLCALTTIDRSRISNAHNNNNNLVSWHRYLLSCSLLLFIYSSPYHPLSLSLRSNLDVTLHIQMNNRHTAHTRGIFQIVISIVAPLKSTPHSHRHHTNNNNKKCMPHHDALYTHPHVVY